MTILDRDGIHYTYSGSVLPFDGMVPITIMLAPKLLFYKIVMAAG